MIENIEEIRQRRVALLQPLHDKLGVAERQHAFRTGQPHKVDGHTRRFCGDRLKRVHFTRRKGQGLPRAEAHHFGRGMNELPHRIALRRQALEQAHSLEEPETKRFAGQGFSQGKLL